MCQQIDHKFYQVIKQKKTQVLEALLILTKTLNGSNTVLSLKESVTQWNPSAGHRSHQSTTIHIIKPDRTDITETHTLSSVSVSFPGSHLQIRLTDISIQIETNKEIVYLLYTFECGRCCNIVCRGHYKHLSCRCSQEGVGVGIDVSTS
jgi:hypothetical protein